jgi:hypothetical protein
MKPFSTLMCVFVLTAAWSQTFPLRINCAADAASAVNGQNWLKDQYFTGGKTAFYNSAQYGGYYDNIDLTGEDAVYYAYRFGNDFSYNIPLSARTYKVRLRFAEIQCASEDTYLLNGNPSNSCNPDQPVVSAGQRVFDVYAEGIVLLKDFDVLATAGQSFRAVDREFFVTVTDGSLTLRFTNNLPTATIRNAAIVNGIEISEENTPAPTVVVNGLRNNAMVSDNIYVTASMPGFPANLPVSARFLLKDADGLDIEMNEIEQSRQIYYLGGEEKGVGKGWNVNILTPGSYTLTASIRVGQKDYTSAPVAFTVYASNLGSFSKGLTAYQNMPTARSLTADQILANTATAGITLPPATLGKRKEMIQMYQDFGIDLSVDSQNSFSVLLEQSRPKNWSPLTPKPLSGKFEQPFSIDACFYQKIPASYPRTALPGGYFDNTQFFSLNSAYNRLGFPIILSKDTDPLKTIRISYTGNPSTTETFRIPDNWCSFLPLGCQDVPGDQPSIFIDPASKTYINLYETGTDPQNAAGVFARASGGKQPLGTLGDIGGTIAAAFSPLPIMIREGELTDLNRPMSHAVGGPVNQMWRARTYPALRWDEFINSLNPPANTGVIPYGGVVQLDPTLRFKQDPASPATNPLYQVTLNNKIYKVHLPAFRILEAMQQYGYYVLDYGDIPWAVYSSVKEEELAPFGGSETYTGSARGGLVEEIRQIFAAAQLYVVPPLVKKPGYPPLTGVGYYATTNTEAVSRTEEKDTFTIIPNPASGKTVLTILSKTPASLSIYTPQGQLVRSVPVINIDKDYRFQLDLYGIAPGLYLCRLTTESTSVTKRLLIF